MGTTMKQMKMELEREDHIFLHEKWNNLIKYSCCFMEKINLQFWFTNILNGDIGYLNDYVLNDPKESFVLWNEIFHNLP